MKESIAFLGLGSMGTAMAKNLLKGGVPLYVYNRTPEKAEELVKEGAVAIASPAEAFKKGNIAITMLANDKALEELTLSPNGLLASIKPGSIHVSMSTISPETAKALEAKHREKKAYFISAPVFGRPEVAAAAKLWICLAGPKEPKAKVHPILELLSQKIADFGEDPSKANVVKLAGNFMILSAVEVMSEAYTLAEKNGIDPKTVANFFSETLFTTPIYQTYGKLVTGSKFEPAGFKMELGLKDINLVLDTSEKSKLPMPIAHLLHDRLLEGLANGRGEWDWSAIALSTRNSGGLK